VRYVLAIVLPPIAVLTTGKILQAVLNLILTLLGFVPGVVHALFVVNDYYADRRASRLLSALRSAPPLR
jgi:uncharacterized membrane protein YqaE (UPF0057 family)